MYISNNEFSPDWISPPGATIADIIDKMGISVPKFAEKISVSPAQLSKIIYGTDEITDDLAIILSNVFGSSVNFWKNRELNYRTALAEAVDLATPDDASYLLEKVKYKDLCDFGWVSHATTKKTKLANLFAFFNVTSVNSWRFHHEQAVFGNVAYKTSTAYQQVDGAVAAWLRQGEISAVGIECAAWNAEGFENCLHQVKSLSMQESPGDFIPKIRDLFSAYGVALVVMRAPKGCRASGATRFLSEKKALMMLSGRYLNDGDFWTTLFHEAGHLIIHENSKLFLEDFDDLNPKFEKEADTFATSVLFPNKEYELLRGQKVSKFDIVRLARKLGVSYGIVVKKLQEEGIITDYKYLSWMKVMYKKEDFIGIGL